jgi:hypothetical protein
MSDTPISIACSECTHQIAKTYKWLREHELLECPACGHPMKAECAAVMGHIEAIRSTIASVAK